MEDCSQKMRVNLFNELQVLQNYQAVFATLEEKSRSEPRRLKTAPVENAISLQWVLKSKSTIIKHLIAQIKSRRYQPGVGVLNRVVLDKPRDLFSLSWPDRIVESVLANSIQRAVDSSLSDNLYSFRKGRSNILAIKRACSWVADTRASRNPIFLAKRDVAQYGDSIPRQQLFTVLKLTLGEQCDYLWELLSAFIQPRLQTSNQLAFPNQIGIPMGLALTPICENLYLSEVDKHFASRHGLLYLRFGDDLLLAHSDPLLLAEYADELEGQLEQRGLSFNGKKSISVALCESPDREVTTPQIVFKPKNHFEYLGYRIGATGHIFLTDKKLAEVKNELRQIAKRAYFNGRASGYRKEDLLGVVIKALNVSMQPGIAPRYVELIIRHCTDQSRLKKLDTWIGKLALRFSFKSGHDRVFRYASLKQLRTHAGLKSLAHMKNTRFRAIKSTRGISS